MEVAFGVAFKGEWECRGGGQVDRVAVAFKPGRLGPCFGDRPQPW